MKRAGGGACLTGLSSSTVREATPAPANSSANEPAGTTAA